MKKFLGEWGKRLSSRKFISAFLIAVIVFGNDYFNWELDPAEVLLAVSGFLGFIGVEGFADIRSR